MRARSDTVTGRRHLGGLCLDTASFLPGAKEDKPEGTSLAHHSPRAVPGSTHAP